MAMISKSLHAMTSGEFSWYLLQPYWPYKWHTWRTTTHFLKWLHCFTVLPAEYNHSNASMSSPTLAIMSLNLTAPVGVKQDLTVVLICICLMTNDVEHVFKCLLAIYVFSWEEKVYSNPYAYFIILFHFILIGFG